MSSQRKQKLIPEIFGIGSGTAFPGWRTGSEKSRSCYQEEKNYG